MYWKNNILLILFFSILTIACSSQEKKETILSTDRQPVVAGSFYPDNPEALKTVLQSLFRSTLWTPAIFVGEFLILTPTFLTYTLYTQRFIGKTITFHERVPPSRQFRPRTRTPNHKLLQTCLPPCSAERFDLFNYQ